MLTKKWYTDIVKERKSWIKHTEKSITLFEEILEDEKKRLELEKHWLEEAEHDLAEYLNSNKQQDVITSFMLLLKSMCSEHGQDNGTLSMADIIKGCSLIAWSM